VSLQRLDEHFESSWNDTLKRQNDRLDLTMSSILGATVEVHSLATVSLNGTHGKVVGRQGDRFKVELGVPWGTKALKPANVKLVRLSEDEECSAILHHSINTHQLYFVPVEGTLGRRLPNISIGGGQVSFERMCAHSTVRFTDEIFKQIDDVVYLTVCQCYKIGITSNPFNRFLEYCRDGYTCMYLLIAVSPDHARDVEDFAIRRYLGFPRCRNQIRGGGGPLPGDDGNTPIFLYLVVQG